MKKTCQGDGWPHVLTVEVAVGRPKALVPPSLGLGVKGFGGFRGLGCLGVWGFRVWGFGVYAFRGLGFRGLRLGGLRV